jgi:hypothetical protein
MRQGNGHKSARECPDETIESTFSGIQKQRWLGRMYLMRYLDPSDLTQLLRPPNHSVIAVADCQTANFANAHQYKIVTDDLNSGSCQYWVRIRSNDGLARRKEEWEF